MFNLREARVVEKRRSGSLKSRVLLFLTHAAAPQAPCAGTERGRDGLGSVRTAASLPSPGSPHRDPAPAASQRRGCGRERRGPWGDDGPLSASLPQKLAVRSCPAAVLVGGGAGGSAKPGGVPALLKAPGGGGGSPGGGPAQSLAISVVPAKAPIAMVTAHLNGGLGGGGGGEPPQSAPINLQTTAARRQPELGARAQVTAAGGRGGPRGGAGREAGGAGSDRAGGAPGWEGGGRREAARREGTTRCGQRTAAVGVRGCAVLREGSGADGVKRGV